MVAVSSYEKRGGTKVRAHSRDAPGTRRQLTVLAAAVLAVFTFSQAGQGTVAGTSTDTGTRGQGRGGNPRTAVDDPGSGGARVPTVRIVFPTGEPQRAHR